jgi:hypothetical protein
MGDPMAAADQDRQMQMMGAQDGMEEQKFKRQLELLRAQGEHGDGELAREEKRTNLQLTAEQQKAKLAQDSEKFNLTAEEKRLKLERERGTFTDKLDDAKHRRTKDLFGTKGKHADADHRRKIEQAKLQQTQNKKRPDPKNPKDAGKKPGKK